MIKIEVTFYLGRTYHIFTEMGQGLSCKISVEHSLLSAVQSGDLETIELVLKRDPARLQCSTLYDRLSPLHVAAANGQIEVLSMLLNRSVNPDLLNRHKQTPLMLATMHGNISCVQKLLEAGANILMFDSLHGRTCLHYAAYYGNFDCLKAILSSARSSHVSVSWGFSRFVNIRDGKGATPLHLAARQKWPECVHLLLDNGALVTSSTGGGPGYPGSTPLHFAARGGSLDCVRILLAWGAERLILDKSGLIPYVIALKYKHGICAALLNPLAVGPLVWPSTLKLISEANPDAKALLENALMVVNGEREKEILKETIYSLPSPLHSNNGSDENINETELCCICFEQVCTIEVQDCGHQMCAQCTLALCCHNKPSPGTTTRSTGPVCPFCRGTIAQLVVAKVKSGSEDEIEVNSPNIRKSRRSLEGSSSFKGLSGVESFSKVNSCVESEWTDKPMES